MMKKIARLKCGLGRSVIFALLVFLFAAGVQAFDPVAGASPEVSWEPPPECDQLSGSYSSVNIWQGFRACFLDEGLRIIRQGDEPGMDLLLSVPCKDRPEESEPFFPPVPVGGVMEYLHPESVLRVAMKPRGLFIDYSGEAAPRFTLNEAWRAEFDETRAALRLLTAEGKGFTLRVESAVDAAGVPLEITWNIRRAESGDRVIELTDPSGKTPLGVKAQLLLSAHSAIRKSNKTSNYSAVVTPGSKNDGAAANEDTGTLLALPIISSIAPDTGSTAGGYTVTLSGSSFGTEGLVFVGGNGVPTNLWSDTSIEFTMPPGQGINIPVYVAIAGQMSNSVYFSYLPPTITSVVPPTGPTMGGTPVTLSGSNFGMSGTVIVGGSPGVPQIWTHNAITFLAPEGQGMNLPVFVIVEGRVSNAVLFSYQPPVIVSVAPSSGYAEGGTPVTIDGNNFGTSGLVTINGNPCSPQSWMHHRISFLTPPGEGINLPVVVAVSGQASPPALFSYDKPRETAPGSTEPEALLWTTADTLGWPVNPDALEGYKLYRGTAADLPALLTADPDSCGRGEQADQNDPVFLGLAEVPGETEGYLFWYIVTGVNASGEGTAGNASSGPRQLESGGSCE